MYEMAMIVDEGGMRAQAEEREGGGRKRTGGKERSVDVDERRTGLG
jgi:hypothetical protein